VVEHLGLDAADVAPAAPTHLRLKLKRRVRRVRFADDVVDVRSRGTRTHRVWARAALLTFGRRAATERGLVPEKVQMLLHIPSAAVVRRGRRRQLRLRRRGKRCGGRVCGAQEAARRGRTRQQLTSGQAVLSRGAPAASHVLELPRTLWSRREPAAEARCVRLWSCRRVAGTRGSETLYAHASGLASSLVGGARAPLSTASRSCVRARGAVLSRVSRDCEAHALSPDSLQHDC
jgi:hypothetical protein